MKKLGKRLAIFLDGTWNSTSSNTNVWRLKCLVSQYDKDGIQQICYYDKGVNGFWGGTFGKGLGGNILAAYEWLVENYQIDDEIFIFGFSRGAYTARSLAGLIAKYGILVPGAPLGTGQIFNRYKLAEDKTIYRLRVMQNSDDNFTTEDKWIVDYSVTANIKMVGVWDTVGSVGIPFFSFEGISRSTFKWMHTGLRQPIQNAFHALAIDELRGDFLPTLWTIKDTTKSEPRALANVEQRWFAGAHANVGGGYESDPLSQQPLQWMVKKADGLGLQFKRTLADLSIEKSQIIDSYGAFMGGAYRKVSRPAIRRIGTEPYLIDGVMSSTINETIDASVFQRMRQDPQYSPPSIKEWAARRGVTPKDIVSSVMTQNPGIQLEQ